MYLCIVSYIVIETAGAVAVTVVGGCCCGNDCGRGLFAVAKVVVHGCGYDLRLWWLL